VVVEAEVAGKEDKAGEKAGEEEMDKNNNKGQSYIDYFQIDEQYLSCKIYHFRMCAKTNRALLFHNL
jgi:hypothetical protein